MTRVSEALARAAQQSGPEVPSPQTVSGFPSEAAAGAWPTEAPSAVGHDAGPVADLQAQESMRLEPAPVHRHRANGRDAKLVTQADANAASVEQYRRLAARLHVAQAEADTRVVMITSAIASEGKTLTATNLALTLSDSYKRRVLLIDADLRRPWVHELFRIPNVTGLNDGIRADVERKVPLIAVTEYLSVLTAGRPDPDPMSVLTSERMRRILADAAKSFDWVIVDTPPVAVLTDAHLLARLVDTVVMVVKAGSTQHAEMTRAVEAVGRDRILGVVLNYAEQGKRMDYHYYGVSKRGQSPATS